MTKKYCVLCFFSIKTRKKPSIFYSIFALKFADFSAPRSPHLRGYFWFACGALGEECLLICKKNLQGSAYCAPNIYNTAIYLRITVRASLSLSAAMPKMQTHARAEERASSLLNLAVGVKFEKCCYKFTSVVRL